METNKRRTMIKNEQERQRIGQHIAQLRKEQGMTQQDLANRVEMQRSHIARIEAGRYSVRLDTLAAIAQALGKRLAFV
jgi:transcriptional regulator with XRE-family HTH domain